MAITDRIEALLEPSLLDKGFRIVRVDLQGSQRKTLQLMIERVDEQPISTDDCVTVSHLASALLDVEDPIPESYTLEVSSAGMDRPLTKKEDFRRFAGCPIKIELKVPYEGSRRLQGILQGLEGDLIKMEIESSSEPGKLAIAEFAFSDIQRAKLIPNYET